MNDFDDDLHVDLTPLIDVIFMLVIFFIMTMSFTIPSIDFELPKAQSAQVSVNNNVINIAINSKGQIMHEGLIIDNNKLIELIKSNTEATISLSIAKDAASEHLIYIADLARIYSQGKMAISVLKSNGDSQSD